MSARHVPMPVRRRDRTRSSSLAESNAVGRSPAPDVAPAQASAGAPDVEIARDADARGSGPAQLAQASPHVAPSLWRGLLILLVYAVIAQGGELLSGFDSADLKASAANALTGLVLPVGLGILAVLLIGGRWGWREVFTERPELRIHKPRSLKLALSLFALAVVIGLATAPWGDWAAGVIALLIVGFLLVGVGEELVCRGFLLVGARSRYSELGAFVLTCVLFGLSHGANVLTGQALGPTLGQITFAAAMGAVFYLLRRTSGLLIVPILVHGLIDVVSIVQAPPA